MDVPAGLLCYCTMHPPFVCFRFPSPIAFSISVAFPPQFLCEIPTASWFIIDAALRAYQCAAPNGAQIPNQKRVLRLFNRTPYREKIRNRILQVSQKELLMLFHSAKDREPTFRNPIEPLLSVHCSVAPGTANPKSEISNPKFVFSPKIVVKTPLLINRCDVLLTERKTVHQSEDMLHNKNAVIYGVSPSLGGAVAMEMARAGAKVFVTNRRLEVARAVAEQIASEGGLAEAAQVDALDADAIQAHLENVIQNAGRVDISFNLIGIDVTQNVPLVKMNVDDFVLPVSVAMRTHFLTATAAGRIMSRQGSGVILTLTATPGGIGYPGVGGFGPLCSAVETFAKNLATELGPSGVRVVNIRSGGSLDSRPFKEAIASGEPMVSEIFKKMKGDTMLKDLPSMHDIASTAVFLASEMARRITGVTLDVTAGTTAALNYKTSEGL